jgi:hypothetical protein
MLRIHLRNLVRTRSMFRRDSRILFLSDHHTPRRLRSRATRTLGTGDYRRVCSLVTFTYRAPLDQIHPKSVSLVR